MENHSHPLTDDPEILALLDFEPVVRKCKRHDGWTPDNQRIFIVGLAETGNVDQAAQRAGRTASGAGKVRTSKGGEGFGKSWDGALALYHRRNPRPLPKGRPSRGEIRAGTGRAWPAAPAPAAPEPVDPEAELRAGKEWLQDILKKYLLKLGQERKARLEGRIIEADYYVRQLTWLEVALDIGGMGMAALDRLNGLERGGHHLIHIVATPMSLLLDEARRRYWREDGGPERPPLPPLGQHDDEVATGLRGESQYWPERDGPFMGWPARSKQLEGVAAEAQAAWEEKARADAEAWRVRVEGEGMAREAPGESPDRAADAEDAGDGVTGSASARAEDPGEADGTEAQP